MKSTRQLGVNAQGTVMASALTSSLRPNWSIAANGEQSGFVGHAKDIVTNKVVIVISLLGSRAEAVPVSKDV